MDPPLPATAPRTSTLGTLELDPSSLTENNKSHSCRVTPWGWSAGICPAPASTWQAILHRHRKPIFLSDRESPLHPNKA